MNHFEIVPMDNQLNSTSETTQIDSVQVICTEDFNSVCRTCLNPKNEVLIPILYSMLQDNKKVVDLLNECASVQVTESDELPSNICMTCCNEIVRIHEFRKQCYNVEQTLKELIQTSQENGSENDLNSTDYSKGTRQFEVIKPKEEPLEENELLLLTSRECEVNVSDTECDPLDLVKVEDEPHGEKPNAFKKDGFECEICHKKFGKQVLKKHIRSQHSKPYQCEICNLTFRFNANLRRHVMTHTGEKQHICQFCGKGFIQLHHLNTHLKIHDEEPDCEENGKFICKYCGRIFKRRFRYIMHVKVHASQDNKIAIEEEELLERTAITPETHPYTCKTCGKQFKFKHQLNNHSMTHRDKTFLCSDCGKNFKTKGALLLHYQIHTGEKPHTCNVCFKSFAYISSLDSHMLVHTGLKPYRCPMCPKSFSQAAHLKYHVRTHTGEKPYSCSYCSKSFAVKGNLTVHVRMHTGETPYLCKVCGRGFYDSSSLKRHQKKNHTHDEIVASENSALDDKTVHSSQEMCDSQEIKLEPNDDSYENAENNC